MDIIHAVILGVVQGVAEWLPISSKTQIMLAATTLMGATPAFAYSLGLFLEAASVVAALLYFRHIYVVALRALAGRGEGRRWLIYMLITTAVTAAVGVPLYIAVKKALGPVPWGLLMVALGFAVIINAVLLRSAASRTSLKGLEDMSLRDMALVGLAQALSVLPGLSRSGLTTSALLLLGYRPEEAFKASFVLVPIAGLGATVLAYLDQGGLLVTREAVVAMAVGVMFSIITINALLRFAKSRHAALVNIVIGTIAVVAGLLGAAAH